MVNQMSAISWMLALPGGDINKELDRFESIPAKELSFPIVDGGKWLTSYIWVLRRV
jgi:hypothetical protein